MIEIKRDRVVDASAEEIWRLIDEPARLSEWFSFADSAELIAGSGVGRRQRMHGRWGKKRSEIDQLVVEYDPPRLLGWRHEGERLDGRPAPKFARETLFSIRLSPVDGRTRVELHSRQEPNGVLRGVVIHLFGRREVATHLTESLDRLEARFGERA